MTTSPRLLLPALLAALAFPAAAAAATTHTVNPGESIQAAVEASSPGDTILIKAGTYNESVSVSKAGLTFTGEAGTVVQSPTSATGATPTFNFTASSGDPDVVGGLIIINAITTGPVVQAGTNGLALRDSIVLGGKGDGVDFAGAAADVVQRSTVVSIAAAGHAVAVSTGTGGSAETLTIDSTALAGKQSLAASYANPTVAGAGMTIAGRHVTAIGDVVADASGSPTLGASPIAVTLADSIVRGKRTATSTGLSAAATITVDSRSSVADSASDIAQLFANPAKFNFHLRADAPVIGKGGVTSGESATDIDGQPRSANGVSDLGADQFVDRAPKAALSSATATARQNQSVTLDASKSTDPDVGDSIATYRWDFGDGQSATTTTPTTTHTYASQGAVTASVTVVDKEGTASDPATLAVTVTDGVPPTINVSSPFKNQRIRGYKGKRRLPVIFFGTATDDTAMGKVVLALRQVAKRGGKCRWFNGKRSLKTAACTTPIVFQATLTANRWTYRLPVKLKLPKGLYYLYAVPVDASGLPGAGKIVKFRIR